MEYSSQVEALSEFGYNDPVFFEVNAPGPDPFTPEKWAGIRSMAEQQLKASAVARRDHYGSE